MGQADTNTNTTSELVLGRYRIVARLAKGGMGVVFLARAEGAAGFAKPVVVKRILPDLDDDNKMTRMFAREARILSNLQHPGIVSVIDFGEENGAYVMVLDYVRAYHLGRWMRYLRSKGELLPVDVAVHVIVKVLEALEYAHTLKLPDGTALSIVHADISPSNILVDSEGLVKIVDFGIARSAEEGPTQASSSAGSVSIKGKMSYLAPEVLGGAQADALTDVYACGVVLYEILVGHSAFYAKDLNQTVARVLLEKPPTVDHERPDASPELGAVVARAMSKDRAERFQSAGELARELRRVRKTPEDEAAATLAELVRRDYQGELPAKLGLTPLNDLEAAWRNPPAEPIAFPSVDAIPIEVGADGAEPAPDPRKPTSAPPTKILEQPPARALSTGPWVGAAIVGVVALVGGGALWASRHKTTDAPDFVVVERGDLAGGTSSAVTSAPTSTSAPGVASTSAPGVASAPSPNLADTNHSNEPTRTSRPAAGSDSLSAAFAKNQGRVEACFQHEVADLKGSPEISVRFSVDRDGRVQSAELLPSSVASLPLGQCILGVAQKTQFPPQSAPVTFRIPIRAHRGR